MFLTHTIETLTQHFERDLDDPRLVHELTLDVDAFGNPLRKLKAAYPRQASKRPRAGARRGGAGQARCW